MDFDAFDGDCCEAIYDRPTPTTLRCEHIATIDFDHI